MKSLIFLNTHRHGSLVPAPTDQAGDVTLGGVLSGEASLKYNIIICKQLGFVPLLCRFRGQ